MAVDVDDPAFGTGRRCLSAAKFLVIMALALVHCSHDDARDGLSKLQGDSSTVFSGCGYIKSEEPVLASGGPAVRVEWEPNTNGHAPVIGACLQQYEPDDNDDSEEFTCGWDFGDGSFFVNEKMHSSGANEFSLALEGLKPSPGDSVAVRLDDGGRTLSFRVNGGGWTPANPKATHQFRDLPQPFKALHLFIFANESTGES